ncbi:MAG: shikimate kinase [Hadesarchaea archaeon]|nr:shikimate kinase [Hadesarchaea archaeon]
MKGIASACGSATIVNAIASGKGAAFAIDLRVNAKVELSKESQEINGIVGETGEDSKLIENCVERVLKKEEVSSDYGAQIKTTAELPIAAGLSSSSAAANATVLATFAALNKEPDPLEAVNIGINAAFEAGTTITGAFDDASASYLGGGTITDNEKRGILKRFNIKPDLKILIYLPPKKSYTQKIDVEKTKLLSEIIETIHQKALNENIYGAQTVNGLIYSSVLGYDPEPALEALEAGAESAGLTGTGPGIVAITKENKIEEIMDFWNSREGRIIETKPSVEGARIENE